MLPLDSLNINFSNWPGNSLLGMQGWNGLLNRHTGMEGSQFSCSTVRAVILTLLKSATLSETQRCKSPKPSYTGPRWHLLFEISEGGTWPGFPSCRKGEITLNAEIMPELAVSSVPPSGPPPSHSIFVLGHDSWPAPTPQSAVTHSWSQINSTLKGRSGRELQCFFLFFFFGGGLVRKVRSNAGGGDLLWGFFYFCLCLIWGNSCTGWGIPLGVPF